MAEDQTIASGRRADPLTAFRIMSDVMAGRAWQWVTGLASFALYGWTCYDPHWIRLAAATCFTIAAHIPTWRKR